MKLADLGEFGLIRRLRSACSAGGDRILLGIGDDAAVIRPEGGRSLILTTDAMAEGVHFDRSYFPLESLGWKCLAVNLSDVAAMGGTPVCCVMTAALPESWSVEEVDALYEGLGKCARRYGCPIVGGDTVRTGGGAVFSAAVLGEVPEGGAVLRSGARAGDLLCVTGVLGGASVGLEVLRAGGRESGRFPESVRRFLEPAPRTGEGASLAGRPGITAMIDISDGLVSEIRHVCEDSGLGCIVFADRIPVSEEAARWADGTGESPVRRALESGEEYELLFTADPRVFPDRGLGTPAGIEGPVTVIGEMRSADRGIRIREGRSEFPLEGRGWDHYRPAVETK
jgi:thiamine-monophosphate kinase